MYDGPYRDIIDLPHHRSATHPHMSPLDRAAQFSPFAALTGYDGLVAEAARQTERRIELTEEEKTLIDQKLAMADGPIEVTYFVPDEKKAGGSYVTYRGALRRVDPVARTLIFADTTIAIDDISDVEIL